MGEMREMRKMMDKSAMRPGGFYWDCDSGKSLVGE